VAATGGDTGPMVRRAMDWLRARPLVADGILAGLLAAFSLVTLGYAVRDCDNGCEPGGAGAVALVLVQTLPLVWRRRFPFIVSLVTGLATAAYGVAPYPDLAMPIPVGGVVGLYSVAAWGSRPAALGAAGFAAVAIAVTVGLPRTDADLVDAMFVTAALAGAWILGDRARLQRAVAAELQERAVRLEHDRAGEARRAVAEERSRIARELHDVVAHHVSMMVVQAEAGPVAVEHDPARAAGAFEAISATGRQALVEMRRLLGVLRGDGDQAPSLAPQPGLDQVPSLVEQVGRAGLEVELVVEGEQGPLPAGVDLSAYRIVQEALTNAVKHGRSSRARIVVRYGPDDLRLEVHDDGPAGDGPAGGGTDPAAGRRGAAGNGVGPASGRQPEAWSRPSADDPPIPTGGFAGRGLVGMRERVALFGGELQVGPDPGGGFTVEARLPIGTARP
jgi:signal transduction histidine kinase